jgi:hypothetical protein
MTTGRQCSRPWLLGSRAGKALLIAVSSPCNATLASSGESGPPWGVPSSVGNSSLPSKTPALSHPRMTRRSAGKGVELVQQCLVVDARERNGITLPTSRAIRPRSPSFERATHSKARRFHCWAGCGAMASSISFSSCLTVLGPSSQPPGPTWILPHHVKQPRSQPLAP